MYARLCRERIYIIHARYLTYRSVHLSGEETSKRGLKRKEPRASFLALGWAWYQIVGLGRTRMHGAGTPSGCACHSAARSRPVRQARPSRRIWGKYPDTLLSSRYYFVAQILRAQRGGGVTPPLEVKHTTQPPFAINITRRHRLVGIRQPSHIAFAYMLNRARVARLQASILPTTFPLSVGLQPSTSPAAPYITEITA